MGKYGAAMNKIVYLILCISVAANVASLYVLDKALFYRSEIITLEQNFPNQGIHVTTEQQMKDADLHPSGVFLGGGLVRLWYLPPDLPVILSNQSSIEEKISTNYEKMKAFVVSSKADYVFLNGGFCEIHTAVNAGRDVETVIKSNFEYLKNIVAMALQNNITPVLTTLTPVRPRFIFPTTGLLEIASVKKEQENEALEIFNGLIRKYASDNNINLIDFHTVMKDENGELKKEYSITDGEHLNARGYQFLNRFLKEQVEIIVIDK